MGRLKGIAFIIAPRPALFQFHYGTIKSLQTLKMLTKILNFNSTMGRLKGSNAEQPSSIIIFQFHYGTIKS